MKVVSLQLPGGNNNGTTGMDRLTLPFNASELLWRYPLLAPPPSPLGESRTHLPPSLSPEPRLWSRDDVVLFLKWCEREFDLPNFDMDLFQMNGKALCLLTKTDLAERCPGAGDVLHNALAMVAREGALLRCLPASPVTPTPRAPYPASPHTHPSTPTWPMDSFAHAHFAAPNSVTLSPAPSVDSQAGSTAGSPQRAEPPVPATYVQTVYGTGAPNSSGTSNNSDSDDEHSPSYTQGGSGSGPRSPKDGAQASPAPAALPHYRSTQPREFFPSDMPEPNTSGRLLWDFLQQLLNDPSQRYTNYIAWKNRETGVFKIVDPAGLAKLWGIQKNHLSMNYDKMSRALRYYYRVNILRKVQGERHCYQFLRNPTELKNIKNISLLRQQMSPTRVPAPVPVKAELKVEDEELPEEEMPTDLSMGAGEPAWRKRPHPDTPTDKHRISSIIGESSQPQRLKMESIEYSQLSFSDHRSHHPDSQYAVLNLKSEKCEQ